jgi:hypothetical protein
MILQPGNVFQAARADVPLQISQELLRIGGASVLGAAVTPLLLGLTRRFRVEGAFRWRNAVIHGLSLLGLSVALVVVAQVLAGWLLTSRDPRLQSPLDRQLADDVPLLIFCMATFVAVAHASEFWRRAEQDRRLLGEARREVAQVPVPEALRSFSTTVSVKSRGRTLILSVMDIDWVETQGNYLALHVGPGTHLIRDTLRNFEASIDRRHFARIHRTTLVAIDRVKEVVALSNGDASVELRDGTQLRLSRKYRAGAAALLTRTSSR